MLILKAPHNEVGPFAIISEDEVSTGQLNDWLTSKFIKAFFTLTT